jgi:hypothetical protein
MDILKGLDGSPFGALIIDLRMEFRQSRRMTIAFVLRIGQEIVCQFLEHAIGSCAGLGLEHCHVRVVLALPFLQSPFKFEMCD